ncbi:MAG: histidine kinase dimerization/phosphoacceptor domain -containing protein [Balneolaceae bacterium]
MTPNDYQLLFRTSWVPTLILKPDAPHFTIVDVNDAYLEATHSQKEDLIGHGLFEAFPDNPAQPESDGVRKLDVSLQEVISHGKPHVMGLVRYDIPVRNQKGTFETSWWEPRNLPVFDSDGTLAWIQHTVQKVVDQERIRVHHLQNLERLERSILEHYEREESPIEDLLHRYLTGIEQLHPGMFTSIMELRDGLLQPWVAPSLPESFQLVLKDLKPGPDKGSCGTSAWFNQKVITRDVRTDPRWEIFRDKIAPFPYRSCWSWPLLSGDGEIIATLALYFERPNVPDDLESLTLERTSHLLQIILDNHRKEEEIRLTNERYHYINLASNEAIYDWDILKDQLEWGDIYFREYADPEDERLLPIRQWTEHLHPDQRDKIMIDLQQTLEDPEQTIWSSSYRFRKKNGQYAYVDEQGYIVRDSLGQAIRMIGTMRDMTERNELEILLNRTHHIARIGSWDVDLINDTVFISESAREMFDLGSTTPITLENALSFYDKSERSKLNFAFMQCVKEGTPFDLEVKAVLRDGSERWIRVLGEADRANDRTLRVYGSFQDITDAHQRQKDLLLSLQEKETLLSEIHHRVKNNLAVVSAMMQLQAATIENPDLVDILQSSVIRIKTMANIHEQLYRSKSFSKIDFSASLQQLISEILAPYESVQPIEKQIQCCSLTLSIQQAIPCSLIVNEVMTNIVKHAFPVGDSTHPSGEFPRVEVRLQSEHDRVLLEICDNGIGLPLKLQPDQEETLGMKLIHQLTWQLDGTCELKRRSEESGTGFMLSFTRSKGRQQAPDRLT